MGKREKSKALQRAKQITQKEVKKTIVSTKCWKIVKQCLKNKASRWDQGPQEHKQILWNQLDGRPEKTTTIYNIIPLVSRT